MKFPVRIRHRKAEATLYGKTKAYPFYRVAVRVNGQRRLQSFATYSEAKAAAEKQVRDLSAGSQRLALSVKEVTAAIAVREALEAYHRETGRAVTPLQAVTGYLEAARILDGRPLSEPVDGYLRTVAVVKRKPLAEAVADFIAHRAPRAQSQNGKRSALNPKYAANVASWLNEFSGMFPGHAVCDLAKTHLDMYGRQHEKLSAKSRNDRRATVKLFFRWCVRNDFLSSAHRLFEADGLAMEPADPAPTDYYRPGELAALLDKSEGALRAIIALQSLAGLRLEEALRLDWADVVRVSGHVEVAVAKSKTRQRRLVEICPALEKWLVPFRGSEGRVGSQWETVNGFAQAFIALRKSLRIPSRRNGLRHGFVTFHYAMHQNENLTAALAGNSPVMIHRHYKGLATKTEAEKWFGVVPKS